MIAAEISDSRLRAYALAKVLYDENKSHGEIFLPFLLMAFTPGESFSTHALRRRLMTQFGFEMPNAVVTKLASTLRKRDLVERTGNRWTRTAPGDELVRDMPQPSDVDRRINQLLEKIREYASNREIDLSATEAQKGLVALIQGNLGYYLRFLSEAHQSDRPSPSNHIESLIVDFLDEAFDNDVASYELTKEVVIGSILIETMAERAGERAEGLFHEVANSELFLDANFLFRVIGLAPEEDCINAKELLKLLTDAGSTVRAFDFTLQEMKNVLERAEENLGTVRADVPLDSMEYFLKAAGHKRSDVAQMRLNLSQRLSQMGVVVEKTRINLERFEPKDKEWRESAEDYWVSKSSRVKNHDFAGIQLIRERRHAAEGRRLCPVFVTSDYSLVNWVDEKVDTEDGWYPEALLDHALTCILWYHSPHANLPLRTVLVGHRRRHFVNEAVWRGFCALLAEMKEDGEVTEQQIVVVLRSAVMKDALARLDEEDIEDPGAAQVVEDIIALAAQEEQISQQENLRRAEELRQKHRRELDAARQEEAAKWSTKWDQGRHLQEKRDAKTRRIIRKLVGILWFGIVPVSLLLAIGMAWNLGFLDRLYDLALRHAVVLGVLGVTGLSIVVLVVKGIRAGYRRNVALLLRRLDISIR